MTSIEKAFKSDERDPQHTHDVVCWKCEESHPAHLPGVGAFRHDHRDCDDDAERSQST